MKEIIISQLRQSVEQNLENAAQTFLREEADKHGIMAGAAFFMDLNALGEITISEYSKSFPELTKQEIEKIVNEAVSKVLRKYLDY